MSSTKLHGRAFYESIGSPKYVVAPMVDQSEFAWRLLTRSFLPSDLRSSILTYSPMLHAKLFADSIKYRNEHFKPLKTPFDQTGTSKQAVAQETVTQTREHFLDGHPEIDRPLFVQFCANDPEVLLSAAKVVAPFCDAVDLNLGCPQGIAKRGGYGAFLQEDWPTIHKLISTLHEHLDIPVTAKMRILETKEKTLEYAKMILSAGASILTVHGRLREQKGHNTGLADWSVIRYLRDNLPPETVMFANGNILQHEDLQRCLDATGVDGIMSAEGNLFDPTIFTPAPKPDEYVREYWRSKDGAKGGWRMDYVLRLYLDIIYKHVLCVEPPERKPLWIPSDPADFTEAPESEGEQPPPTKKQKRDTAKKERPHDVNQTAMQAHMFNMLRAMVGKHHNVRDALAQTRVGEMETFEKVLRLVEAAVRTGLEEYERDPAAFDEPADADADADENDQNPDSSAAAIRRCRKPFFVCQPHIRPSPKEAMAKGSIQIGKKERRKLEAAEKAAAQVAKDSGVAPHGAVEHVHVNNTTDTKAAESAPAQEKQETIDIPREGLVCG